MSAAGPTPPPLRPEPVPRPAATLRRLFLLLFLRGRGARGLNRQGAPKSIGQKLALTLLFYALFGGMALFFLHQPVFGLAVYLHGMTFVFLGMFVASSAGEVLFNKEEADILLHRPVTAKVMLWAKIRVLVEVSLWLAGAFNLAGLLVGFGSAHNWRFPLVHIASTTLEALFCTGCVVLVYQLCLRWFGRERLEGLMTIAQVLVSVAAVIAGQVVPQVVMRFDHALAVTELSWWINLFPPAWFAGLDDALAGSAAPGAWILAGLALAATAVVLWLAFDKLARDYEAGLQALNETVSAKTGQRNRPRWLDRVTEWPPLRWWLRDPVTRAAFLLTAAYLLRDRDVKLRVYPGIVPILIIPFVFLIRNGRGDSNDPGFGVPLSGLYLGMVPMLALQILEYSQQWQAADIFRAAPLARPAPLCHGARRAVLFFLAMPMLLLVGIVVWLLRGDPAQLLLLLPGIILLPVFALFANRGGHGVPFARPPDASKSASRGLSMIAITIASFALAALASLAWQHGWFWPLLAAEAAVALAAYLLLRLNLARSPWPGEV